MFTNDTLKHFETWCSDRGFSTAKHSDDRVTMHIDPDTRLRWSGWNACQKLNDARINTLNDAITEDKIVQDRITSLESQLADALAVIVKKDELISQCIENNLHLADGDVCTLKLVKDALAIKPGDVTLVEVGYASEPSIRNLINGNDVIVGKKNDIRTEAVYTIQTKSNTE